VPANLCVAGIHQDILWLQIPVHDTVHVRVVDCLQDLEQEGL